jgi:serine/threonine protein kinase
MAVLVEAFSVIVRVSTISDRYPGGMAAYRGNCPNRSFCMDGHLTRVGFMSPADVQTYVGQLELLKIVFIRDGAAIDVVVVDQNNGPTSACDWVDFTHTSDGIACCWLKGSDPSEIAAPPDWKPGRVSHSDDAPSPALQARGHRDRLDLFKDPLTDRERYVGRAYSSSSSQSLESLRSRAANRLETGQWEVGQRLGDRWPIYRVMGGGMGVVYVVYDPDLAQLAAAKTFRAEVFADNASSDVVQRFRNEANAWVQIGAHPNVVQAHRVVSVSGTPYLLLEYVSGGELSSWIGTPRLTDDLPQVLMFGIDFCRGMIHAAAQGLEAHRDIKPANCLVTESGTLKVTDFGLVKTLEESLPAAQPHPATRQPSLLRRLFGSRPSAAPVPTDELPPSLTATGAMAGTPTHMAPEQFGDVRHADRRSDIYSFGVMLYQMVTGHLPFEGRSVDEYVHLHRAATIPPIKHPEQALVSGINKCLAKQPSDRFSDFVQVEEWLSSLYSRISGSPPPAPEPVASPRIQFLSRAYNFANLGMHGDALTICDEALEADANAFEIWSLKGSLLSTMEQHTSALRCHDRAVHLQSDHPRVWHSKGVTLNAMSSFGEAIECYDRSLAINDLDPRVWYDKGVSLQRCGQITEASRCWDRSLTLSPDNPIAWCNQGSAMSELGGLDAAISCYRRALDLDPRDATAWYGLGLAIAGRGQDSAEAKECLLVAKTLGLPQADEAMRSLGLDSAR